MEYTRWEYLILWCADLNIDGGRKFAFLHF